MYSQMMGSNHYGTISDADPRGRFSHKSKNKISSEGYYDGQARPPKISKKIRPYSAPRNQGMKSTGLKNRVTQSQNMSKATFDTSLYRLVFSFMKFLVPPKTSASNLL